MCYNKGCSYLSIVFGKTFDQYSNRFYSIPKLCKFYDETADPTNKNYDENVKELFCRSYAQGNFSNIYVKYKYKSSLHTHNNVINIAPHAHVWANSLAQGGYKQPRATTRCRWWLPHGGGVAMH